MACLHATSLTQPHITCLRKKARAYNESGSLCLPTKTWIKLFLLTLYDGPCSKHRCVAYVAY